ncbi:hypothetical protein [Glycomyces harbinensis]|uniref:Uncharacterized protein n=1 Tax=Glycomyces harbinensis TaxID=58114 RepID=A0A1G6Z4Q2_9ACTN|nr:hypothetical protein [Glycomyces harbinensis]SDD97744.1 hypothetical protein SAMN05216270_11060 [Glycomyces harbinensis]
MGETIIKEKVKRGMAGTPPLDYRRLRADLDEAFDTELSDPYERSDDCSSR